MRQGASKLTRSAFKLRNSTEHKMAGEAARLQACAHVVGDNRALIGKRLTQQIAVIGVAAIFIASSLISCRPAESTHRPVIAHDIHSWSNPELARVAHLNLDLQIVFEQQTI